MFGTLSKLEDEWMLRLTNLELIDAGFNIKKTTFKLYFDGDVEENGECTEILHFEDEDEGNVNFNWEED